MEGLHPAELRLQYLGQAQGSPGVFGVPEFNADLFGIGARPTATILSSDYYDGDALLSTDTLISQDIVSRETLPGSLSITPTSLLDFIRSLYLPDGTPTGAFAVFRVNPDIDLPPFSGRLRGYVFASSDNPDSTFVPRLDLEVALAAVPEPNSLVLFSVSALAWGGVAWWWKQQNPQSPGNRLGGTHV